MKDYTITLKKILGKEKYEELVDYTFKNIRNKFGNIKADKAVNIAKVNHQFLVIIALLKAKNFEDNVIIEFLHWNKKKAFKFVITNSFDNFVSIYKEYLDSVIDFLKNSYILNFMQIKLLYSVIFKRLMLFFYLKFFLNFVFDIVLFKIKWEVKKWNKS